MIEKGKTLANDMAKAATLQQQQQVQQQVVAAMAYVPGSETYYKALYTEQPFYMQEQIYKRIKFPDSKIGLRNNFAQQVLHQKMIDLQYKPEDLSEYYKGIDY